jgi:L-ascorbate metabolism protein UlaG (beta-lactamase superfamily)
MFRAIFVCLLTLASAAVAAEGVKITPLGSHDGEFCRFDRAMLLEDPDGTRLLYDPGRTVAGAADGRLGKLDAVLVSHLHGDHVGDRHIEAPNQGSCADPQMPTSALPATNAVTVAVATGAAIVTGSEMPKFFAGKLAAAGGDPAKSLLVRFGASRQLGGVRITTVPAAHSNGIAGPFIGGRLGELLDAAGVTAYAGPPTGYVLTFSNGLVVYLSGDTGITAEQKTVIGDYYRPRLAVVNIGDTFTTGPREAAHVVNDLVRPASVIPSHANEAATQDGAVVPGTRTAEFSAAVYVPVHLPLSGRTMIFNGAGRCTEGCR